MTDVKLFKRVHLVDLAVAGVICVMTVGHSAWAQPNESLVLEEVVVTAQKREQSVQDVPSTVNVLSGDTLKDYNLFDFADLEQLTPGLDTTNVDARSGSVSLRGINYNPNSAAEQAVDVYWNDTPVRGGGGVFQQLFDIGRVEVLRGPQGTLQGRSSPAGAIMIHTAKPDLEEIEGNIATTVTDNGGNNTRFGVSVPIISGTLGTRIAGSFDESELDQIENIVTGNETNSRSKAGRFSTTWLPTDALSVDLAYQYVENDVDDLNVLQGAPLQDPTLPVLDFSDRKAAQVLEDLTGARYERASLKVGWDFGDHQLTFLSGYAEVDSKRDRDQSEGNQNPADAQLRIQEDKSFSSSQELRFQNVDSEVWEYMVGLYYASESGHFIQRDFRIGGGPDRDRFVKAPFDVETVAVFTHHIVHVTDALTLQAGLRWQERDTTVEANMFAGPQGLFGLLEGTFAQSLIPEESQDRSDSAVTGSVNVQYYFNDPDLMVYASYSTAYRPGGVTVGGAPLGDLLEFEEEDSWAIEAGFKSNLWDGRAQLSGSLFYQEFENYITRVTRINVSTDPNQVSITDNGDAELTGAELEFTALLNENWQVGGGLSYTQAEFQSGSGVVCNVLDAGGNPVIPAGQVAATCDVGGDPLGPEPDWSVTLNSEYTLPFSDYEGYLRGLYKYTGDREDSDIGELDAYQTFDLYLGVRSEARVWDVSFFAKNLFDEEEIQQATPDILIRRQANGYQPVDVVPQRVIGINASYNF